jgi:secreted trypsin-like serine protease
VIDDAGPKRIFMTFDAPPAGAALEGVGAPGDSGGPAFIEVDGRLRLAGVSSASMNGKPGTYGVVDVYTRVSAYVDWIERTIAG